MKALPAKFALDVLVLGVVMSLPVILRSDGAGDARSRPPDEAAGFVSLARWNTGTKS